MPVHDPIRVETAAVLSRITALMRTYPELADDDDLLASALEGQTDLHEVAARIVDAERDACTYSEAIRVRRAELGERQERFERRSHALRKLLQSLLETAGIPKLVLPAATVSISKGRASVAITDEDAVPSQLCKIIRQPDKKAIGDQLRAGETVPGAILVAGDDTVTIRTK